MNCFWHDFTTLYIYLQCTDIHMILNISRSKEISDSLEWFHRIKDLLFLELEDAIDEENNLISLWQTELETSRPFYKDKWTYGWIIELWLCKQLL